MSGRTFPLTVVAQIKHGVLWEAAKVLGSQKALADALGLGQQMIGMLINFSYAPGAEWVERHGARVEAGLSEILGRSVSIEELFPPELRSKKFQAMQKRVERTIEVAPEKLIEAGAAPILPPAPESVELKSDVDKVIGTLRPRLQRIIRMRFGLDGDSPANLDEIAEAEGVTRERIRQLEAKALRCLRFPGRSKHLKAYVNQA